MYCMMDGAPAECLVVKPDKRGPAPDPKNSDKLPLKNHILSYPGRIFDYVLAIYNAIILSSRKTDNYDQARRP